MLTSRQMADLETLVNGTSGRDLYKKVMVPLHAIIWVLHHGPIPEGYVIDHIDRDIYNNNPLNLRLLTKSQNIFAQVPYNQNKEGLGSNFKGVSYDSVKQRWRFQMKSKIAKVSRSSSCKTETEAAKAYDRSVLELLPDSIKYEHDLPGNVAGRFIPYLNFQV